MLKLSFDTGIRYPGKMIARTRDPIAKMRFGFIGPCSSQISDFLAASGILIRSPSVILGTKPQMGLIWLSKAAYSLD